MSNGKRTALQRRRRRARRATMTVDIETRGHGVKGGEGFIGDCHVGMGYDQMLAYAHGSGLTEFTLIAGGDLIYDYDGRLHEDQHFTGEHWKP